ncbi:MAG TPA: diguanylate cyclase [Calditrichia bacterium]|nr:diguanylate cyclase [Calditrichia bacterium]
MDVKKLSPNPEGRILLVDDEPAMHKMLQTYFRKQDFVLESCMASPEIVDRINDFGPDLVLLDLMMPDLDGISATRRIRNMGLASYLPIIVVTAKNDVKDMVTALEAGADDYITKPFQFEELLARIRNMLRMKRLQDRLMHKSEELDEANQQINRLNSVLLNTNKQLQKKVYDFHNLFEVSYRVMGQLEFQNLVKQALLNILGIFATRNAMLMLTSREDPDLFEVVDSRGFRSLSLQSFKLYRHDKLIHYLELVKKAFQIRDIKSEFAEILPEMQKMEIEVVSPVFRKDHVVGLLCLGPNFREEEYTEDSLETLGILTNMLAVAVNNAQMYEHIRALSYTDGMTGLHNYRFFRLRIKEEIARARREDSALSLLIMDVDYFKNYNDTLGHPAGDEVLRKVSQILKLSVRDNDIVARYGGEEFAIILPSADKEGARVLAERIRAKVEAAEFYREEIQPNGQITISIGAATFPADAPNGKDLVVRADKALYQAKKTGRNRVVDFKEIEELS